MKKKKKNIAVSPSISREMMAFLYISLGFFVFVSSQFEDATGLVGYFLGTVFSSLLGHQGYAFLPLFITLIGIAFLITPYSHRRISCFIGINFLSFLLAFDSIGSYTFTSLSAASSNISPVSGWLGTYLTTFSLMLLGKFGLLIVTGCLFFVSLFSVFGRILWDTLIGLNHRFSSRSSKKVKTLSATNTTVKSRWRQALIHRLFYRRKFAESLPFDDLIMQKSVETSSFSTAKETALSSDSASNTRMDAAPHLENPEDLSFLEDIEALEESDEYEETKLGSKDATQPILTTQTDYKIPPMHLLKRGKAAKVNTKETLKHNKEQAKILEMTLSSFNVTAKVVNITSGPSVTRFELQPGDGVKISKITSLAKDIALKLAATDIRIEAPIPGKALVGIEVPNSAVEMITIRSIMESHGFSDISSPLMTVLGLTITGEGILMDLAKMPHVLIAGATGSGKSVCINAIILSILMKARPDEVKFLMIDPKKVELSLYQDIPHLIAPVVTNPHKAAATLKKWALAEMESRYELFSKVGVKDIGGFNDLVESKKRTAEGSSRPDTSNSDVSDDSGSDPLLKLPYIVVVIDELADLMMVAAQDVETTICRLAQMARATGIHLVIATQRPSVNVVTGLIKANVPSRISFFLQSQIDSRTILDMPGAEKLLGKGDMLYSPVGAFKPSRAQGVFVSESEVKNVVEWLKKQSRPEYDQEVMDVEPLEEASSESSDDSKDSLYDEAKQLIMSTQYASTSYLQRKLRIGYNRAARIMDELTEDGIIAQYAGEKKPRNVSASVE